MFVAVDVFYAKSSAVAAAVLFADWDSESPLAELHEQFDNIEPYTPGSFYKRELPCLLKLLGQIEERPEAIIVDAHVWLGPDRPGLGAHLYSALGEKIPVIGVAKRPFGREASPQKVYRGRSERPLYVTAVGMDPETAARNIAAMSGPHRIPTLLKRADRLCRREAVRIDSSPPAVHLNSGHGGTG